LPVSRWTEEVDHLVAVDEVELGKGENAVAVEGGLEREVEASEGLDCRELGHTKRHLDASVLAQRNSSANRVSITSSALASPRSSWRMV
jgi:hypothetical protein